MRSGTSTTSVPSAPPVAARPGAGAWRLSREITSSSPGMASRSSASAALGVGQRGDEAADGADPHPLVGHPVHHVLVDADEAGHDAAVAEAVPAGGLPRHAGPVEGDHLEAVVESGEPDDPLAVSLL